MGGGVLKIFTPVAFSLWLVAGEVILRRILVPMLFINKRFLEQAGEIARSMFCPCGYPGEDEEDDDEDDNDEGDQEEKLDDDNDEKQEVENQNVKKDVDGD